MTPAAPPIRARLARALPASVDPAAAAALARWIELVASWNARVDLTAARGDDELVDLMVADAVILAAHLPAGRRVIDVGSGAGAPGLPLAILRPDLQVTLAEPLQKRVAFLRTAIGTLLQAGAPLATAPRVERARGEELVRGGRSFDAAISRATLPPDAWLELGAALTATSAAGVAAERADEAREVWVLLAREPPPARAGWRVTTDLRYPWPLTHVERRAVRFSPFPLTPLTPEDAA